MVSRKNLWIGAVAAVAAISSIAIASERNEVSEKKIALSDVPAAAMQGARSQLASVTKAELVHLKDGRTVYELKGKSQAGKTVELYVSADGQVVGTEDDD